MSETKVVYEVKLSKPVFVIATVIAVGALLNGVSPFVPEPAWANKTVRTYGSLDISGGFDGNIRGSLDVDGSLDVVNQGGVLSSFRISCHYGCD